MCFNAPVDKRAQRRSPRQALRLRDQASLNEKLLRSEDVHDRFLPLLGRHHNLDLAVVDVKDSVPSLSLREDNGIVPIVESGSAAIHGGEKYLRVKGVFSPSLPSPLHAADPHGAVLDT
jgi:hypothetical protein